MSELILVHLKHKNEPVILNRQLIVSIEVAENKSGEYTLVKMVNGDQFSIVESGNHLATADPEK